MSADDGLCFARVLYWQLLHWQEFNYVVTQNLNWLADNERDYFPYSLNLKGHSGSTDLCQGWSPILQDSKKALWLCTQKWNGVLLCPCSTSPRSWCNSITFATELQLILVTNKQTNRQTAKLNKDLWRGFLWLHKHTMTHRNLDFITCAKHVQPPTLWLTCNDISPSPCRWAATSAGVMSLLGGGSGRGLRCSRRLLSFL